MPSYLLDSDANLLQAVINKAFKLGYLSSVLDRQLFNKLNTNHSPEHTLETLCPFKFASEQK